MGIFKNTTIIKVNDYEDSTIIKVNDYEASTILDVNDYEASTWERRLTETSIIDPKYNLLVDANGNTLRAL